MSKTTLAAQGDDGALLRELLGGLRAVLGRPDFTVGLGGSRLVHPQAPAHCVRNCLGGDPEAVATHGCAFLIAALLGSHGHASLPEACCKLGFRVTVQPLALGSESARLMTVGDDAGALGHALDVRLEALTRLVERVGQLAEENAGFAEEVLQSYEQLNLIFDLIPDIAQVDDTTAIESLLLQRVAQLLGVEAVYTVLPDRSVRWGGDLLPVADAAALLGELGPLVKNVQSERRVQVAHVGSGPVLAGALVRLDDVAHVIIARRRDGQPTFTAGDMLLTDSVLAFGGQLIRNNELHEQLRAMSIEVTRALVAAIDKKDHYTSGHSERVGFLTRLTAQEFGLSAAELQITEWAGLLHDIGKIGIPEEILRKPGKLTLEEFDVIKQHPRMGYDILKPIARFELVLDGVLYHHEQPDGGGYPEGRHGDYIPLVARIIHVADTFDALTSTRSYRRAYTFERALQIIREEMGTRIDGSAAEAFFRAFERYRRENPQGFAYMFRHHLEHEDASI